MEAREYEQSFTLEGAHWWFRAKRALVLALLRRYGWPQHRALDLGCGTGGLLQVLVGQGGRAAWLGADAEPRALAFCRKRGLDRLAAASAVSLPFRDGAFDACLCLDVLYHRGVASDAEALTECYRVLAPGGLLVVTDSAFAWLRSAHDDAVHGRRRYTRAELVSRVQAAGFTPLFASYTYCLVFPAIVLFRLVRALRGARAEKGSDLFPLPGALTTPLLAVQAVERALLRWTALPFGSSVLCVARK